jgi:hypothetical protein
MKRFPSWIPTLRRIFLVAAVLATAVAAAYVEENIRGEREWRRFEQECRDEGKPLDYVFYKPAPIPEDENLFRAPVLVQFLDSQKSPGPFTTDVRYLELQKLMGTWQRGEASHLDLVYTILKETPDGGGADHQGAAQLILESLRPVQRDLDAVDDAALRRPRSQIEFRDDGSLTPTFRVLRYFTQTLTLRAAAELEIGQNDNAYKDIYATLRLTEGADSFPSFLHILMANVMGTKALQPYWEGCVRHVWTDTQLKTVGELLSGFHPLRELPTALAASRAAIAPAYRSGLMRPRWMPLGWWDLNIVNFFGPQTGAGNFWSYDPVAEQLDLKALDRASARVEELRHSASPFTWLARTNGLPHLMPFFVAEAHNSFVLASTASALERYRLENARYPSELSQLVPTFIQAVPHDVIDGKPLRYSCIDGIHFKLYSVGLNGVDDHGALPGAPTNPTMTFAPWSSMEGDWIWPQSPSK